MIYNPGMRRFAHVVLFICASVLALAMPLVAIAGVRITEVMYDADGTDTKREWVELYNEGPDAVNLTDWKFADKSSHVLNVPPKNGGLGSMMLAPGRYAILAADASIFAQEYPGISIVIDTAMNLNNAGGMVAIRNNTTTVDSMAYAKSQGGSDDGDSLQLNDGVWIHAFPTPGQKNATTPSVHTVHTAAPAAKKTTAAKAPAPKPAPLVATADAETAESNDPLAIVNATPSDETLSQTAAAGVLGGSVWWVAALTLAIGTGAVASLISRTKKNEWEIVESE